MEKKREDEKRKREREKKFKRGNVEGGMFGSWTGSESAPLPIHAKP